MAYTRTKKLTDASYSPTNPASESAIRLQIDDSINEVLTLLDAGKQETSSAVTTNTPQTVTGVKTFSTSPIVPAPSVSGDVATKGYVDTTIGAVVLGQIPDTTITPAKLSFAPATQVELDAVNTTLTTNLATTTGLVGRINSLYLRNNAGTLEWSTDNATWNAVGGGGLGSFEFGLPII